MLPIESVKIAIIGLGYVGLPLAIEFAKQMPVVGYDINKDRVDALNKGVDRTLEVSEQELSSAQYLTITSDKSALQDCNFYIVTVPTPIDANKQPDLTPLKQASELLATMLVAGDIVVYESTLDSHINRHTWQ